MGATGETPGRVFVSYSHDSAEHDARVLALANQLRLDGIDAQLDEYETAPAEGWPLWMARGIRDAQYVVMVCTPTYYARVMGDEQRAGKGLGARWEGYLSVQDLYDAGAQNTKFIPVLLAGEQVGAIPNPLRGATHYRIADTANLAADAGYETLYRRLTEQPRTLRPVLGQRRVLPPVSPGAGPVPPTSGGATATGATPKSRQKLGERSASRATATGAKKKPYAAVVRRFVEAALSAGELQTLCFDYFPEVYGEFEAGQSRGQRTLLLLEHAERRGRLEELEGLVQGINPAQHARFAAELAASKR